MVLNYDDNDFVIIYILEEDMFGNTLYQYFPEEDDVMYIDCKCTSRYYIIIQLKMATFNNDDDDNNILYKRFSISTKSSEDDNFITYPFFFNYNQDLNRIPVTLRNDILILQLYCNKKLIKDISFNIKYMNR